MNDNQDNESETPPQDDVAPEHFDSDDYQDESVDDQAAIDAVHGETRDEEIERLRESSESAEKRVLQAQAEAENFRKRLRRDFEDQMRFASLPLINDLLAVRDNLNRATEAAHQTSDFQGLLGGVEMVVKQWDDTLAKYNVHPIPTEGEAFDPNVHEAISQMPSEEFPEGAISHVASVGYQLHDRVIRPSQVVVSSGKQ